ncbi:MAG: hypothetical protein ACD_63C00064G0010 [uncultured bacterium]|nr:MAG: hypothetical protein ACD_63C00064G0010 [uncultured bacterium]
MEKKTEEILNIIPATKIALGRNQVFSYKFKSQCRRGGTKIKSAAGQLFAISLGNRKINGVVLNTSKKSKFRNLKTVLNILDAKPVLTKAQLKLAKWIADYYMTSLGLVIKMMLPKQIKQRSTSRNRKIFIKKRKPPKLLPIQEKAVKTILTSKKPTTLLFGVTGSGKTEVYMRVIDKMIKNKKQSIVLVPEISLTPQIIKRFQERFGTGKIAVLHSKMSYGSKYAEWQKIRDKKAMVVIGPRSAIFAPVRNLGLIAIDEEHETSYKQWDQHPLYHTRDVAVKYIELTKAKLILGSATPSIESYHNAKNGKYNLAELPNRIQLEQKKYSNKNINIVQNDKMPEVDIVDMRDELASGNKSIFSERLQEELANVLRRKEQAILFINRRGTSTFVMCRDCGHVMRCQDCEVPLTYHRQNFTNRLICHHCNFKTEVPINCPKCKSAWIKFFGAGTQRVEQELKKLFPRARRLRMDTDTTSKINAHENIFNTFANHEADILIGTQMIAKGWDLQKVATVGIISADTLLNIPDFRSNERTFELLTQVAGRTGRGKKKGSVILQTYNPENFIIRTAAKHDYKSFYKKEIRERKELNYPPFSKVIKLAYSSKDPKKASAEAEKLSKSLLKSKTKGCTILGPAPAFIPKIRGKYIWNIILKNWTNKDFLKKIQSWSIDIDPINTL